MRTSPFLAEMTFLLLQSLKVPLKKESNPCAKRTLPIGWA